MIATQPSAATRTARSGLAPMHMLLGAQSIIVVLVSINRLSTLALGYVAANEFLRWVDLNNMLLALASTLATYLLKQHLERTHPDMASRPLRVLGVVFIVGVYLLAASYGNHEFTNYLHQRFCDPDDASALCRIVIFNDDEFSHWLFFSGFVLMNTVVLLLQALSTYQGVVRAADWWLLAFNGLWIGLGIFANLAFEVIGLDLYVVALLFVITLTLVRLRGVQPLFVYYITAYGLGLIGTALYKIVAA